MISRPASHRPDAAGMRSDLTGAIAQKIAGTRFEELDEPVRELARLCLLDHVAVAIAGCREPLVALLVEDAAEDGSNGSASLLGQRARVSPRQAALINGSAAHALDYDDAHDGLGHPSAVIYPAILAGAERRKLPGRRLIEAFVAGFDAGACVASLLGPGHYARGFHTTATAGTVGAAVGYLRLAQRDQDTSRRTIGLAATQAGGLKAMFGSMGKAFHAGKAGENGILAARLAMRGFGSPGDILDHPQGIAALTDKLDFDAAYHELDKLHSIEAVLFKHHASCFRTHASLDALSAIMREHGIDGAMVARLVICNDEASRHVCAIARPQTGAEIKFSLATVAALVLCGRDTSQTALYCDSTARDPAMLAAREKVHVIFSARLRPTEAEVTLETRDGRRITLAHDSGRTVDPFEYRPQLVGKFKTLVSPLLGPAQTSRLAEIILTIDQAEQLDEFWDLATMGEGMTAHGSPAIHAKRGPAARRPDIPGGGTIEEQQDV
jgi:2-methylcitrate dehydratase PrpD